MDSYRLPFYEQLRERLDMAAVDVDVIYGSVLEHEKHHAVGELSWGREVTNRHFALGRRELVWQPALRSTAAADLIIVVQQARLVLTYALLLRQTLGGPPVAFWGHGRNFQEASASRAGEAVKRRISRWPAWWFAYNDFVAGVVRDLGYPGTRITNVQNAIDTRTLAAAKDRLSAVDLERLRDDLGIKGRHVGIYCGSLYPERDIPHLLAVTHQVKALVPGFEMIVVGGGDSALVEDAAAANPWIHYVGRKLGVSRVGYFALADVFLMPGPVGLAVLDSFALATPMIVSTARTHGPEFHYLEDQVNSVLVDDDDDPRRYAAGVAEVLHDPGLRARLIEGGRRASERYTIEEMVERFSNGILAALELRQSLNQARRSVFRPRRS
jgi:glycosyltransferase involved in cell wall biosynthesis